MNGKNLPLKFGILAIIVALSITSLMMKGLRLGIDLQGGAEIVYRILPGVDGDEADSGLARRMINVLKQRVDPGGLMNLEWRPMGKDRFAIRMPAPRADSREARDAYIAALDELDARNITPSEINRIADIPAGPDRQKEIDALAGDDKTLGRDLAALIAAQDAVRQARKDGDSNAEAEAGANWRKRLREFKVNHDLRKVEMETVLQRYASAYGLSDRTRAKLRMAEYDKALDRLYEKFPLRKEEVDKCVETHKGWIDVRQHLEDPADLKRLVARAGQLEFRIAPASPGSSREAMPISDVDYRSYTNALHTDGPEAAKRENKALQWFPANGTASDYGSIVSATYAGQLYVLLQNDTKGGYTMLQSRGDMSWSLSRAYPTTDETGGPAVGFEFDERGSKQFATLTQAHTGHFMAVLLDDTVYSCPVIRTTISSRGIISGSFSGDEVRELVRILEAGSLPARLDPTPVAESKFGPAIGEISREMGFRAAWAGIIAVAVFMLIYYMRAGFIADVALLLNIILVVGVMSMFDVVLTLPGIAGVILTIGIAVDANVLIFERLREEQARGQSVGVAIKNAYERALSAIFDANITTLVTCLILGWVSTEEVKGFAITLGLGVAFSLFTALVVTRWIFQAMAAAGLLKKPVFMLHLIGVPKINWMAKRRWFWGLSLVMVVSGVVAFASQGGDVFGIEFSGGTKAVLQLKDGELIDGKLPSDELIRAQLSSAAEELDLGKLKGTARVEVLEDPGRAKNFVEAYDTDGSKTVTLDELPSADGKTPAKDRDGLSPYFKQLVIAIDENDDGVLEPGELEDLPPLSYQMTTTETQIAKVRQVAETALGSSLKRQLPCTFDLIKGRSLAKSGFPAAGANGLRRIRLTDGEGLDADLQDYDGGLMIAVENLTPPLSVEEIRQRISDMRFQPDYAAQRQNTCKISPLQETNDGKCGSFVLLVRHSTGKPLDDQQWQSFAASEIDLLTAALERAESTVAVNIDPSIAGETAQSAIVAIILSWLAIVGYLWLRFGSPQWGLAAVVCLVHDVIIVLGMVAISNTVIGKALGCPGFKIDLPMIAAILTVIGYSVNDTIVVFDRIRENRGRLTAISERTINASINQTLGRTLLTSSTTFIVVLIMFVWGGQGIHAFNYALLVGIIFGTYSSIAIASPLLLGFKEAVAARAATAGSEG